MARIVVWSRLDVDMEGGMRGICAKVMYKYVLFGCFTPRGVIWPSLGEEETMVL